MATKATTQTRRLLPLLPPLVFDLTPRVRLFAPRQTVDLHGSARMVTAELSMEHASTLELTVLDPAGALWKDPVLKQPLTLIWGDDDTTQYVRQWRLWTAHNVGTVTRQGSDTVMTFWDAGSAALKLDDSPLTRPAGNMNLQGWVELLAGRVADYYPLSALVPRPNSSPPRDTDQPDAQTAAGFAPGNKDKVTVKGKPASSEQLKAIDRVLSTCVKEKAAARAVWATVTANIGESEYRVDVVNSIGATGIYQVIPSTAKATGLDPLDVEGCTKYFLNTGFYKYGGAKKLAKDASLTPGEIASKVEGSDQGGSFYQTYAPEARTIIELWSGRDLSQWHEVSGASDTFSAGAAGDTTSSDARPTEWRRGRPDEPESSLKCLARISEGLGRRSFVSVNRIVVPRDQDLILAAPHLSMSLIGDPIIVGQRPSIDRSGTIQFTAQASQWCAPPGAVVEITDSGPVERFWLVTYVRTGPNRTVEVQLQQPTTKIPSGNGSTKTAAQPDTSGGAPLTAGSLAYPLARKGEDLGGPAAHAARAWGNWQSDNAVDLGVPMGTRVFAVDSGTITRLGGSWNGGAGNPDGFNVTLKTSDNQWFYTHLSQREPLRIGQRITKGRYLGLSGAANGVKHLHIACLNGNPEELLRNAHASSTANDQANNAGQVAGEVAGSLIGSLLG